MITSIGAKGGSRGEGTRASPMAAREGGAGRERRPNLKASIHFLCRSLASVGVGNLLPEEVRQAKFNVHGPRIQLWKALHDLLVLSQNGFCARVAKALKAQGTDQAQAIVEYAAVQLDVLGCPFLSMFDQPSQIGSRRLLLALAWLMARTKVTEVIMERAVRNVQKGSLVAHCPTICPQDTLFCHHTRERFESAHGEARVRVDAALSQVDDDTDAWTAVDARSNQVLVLSGKIRAQINHFLAAQTGYMRKTNGLKEAQRSGELAPEGRPDGARPDRSPPLSCFDVFLAASKKRLESYCKHLEEVAKTTAFLREFSLHIHDFLSWISTVKELHEAEAGEDADGGGGMGGPSLVALARIEEEGFRDFDREIQRRVLARVRTSQASDLISAEVCRLVDLWPAGIREERGRNPKGEFSVAVLEFLVNLDRSLQAERERAGPERPAQTQEERRDRERERSEVEEERLETYREALLGVSRTQAKARAQHSAQFDQVLRFMDSLDITRRRQPLSP